MIIKRIDLGSTDLRFVRTPDDFGYLVFDSYHQSSAYATNNYHFYTFVKQVDKDYQPVKPRKILYRVAETEGRNFVLDKFYKVEHDFYSLDTNIIKKEDLGKFHAMQDYEIEPFGFTYGRIFQLLINRKKDDNKVC